MYKRHRCTKSRDRSEDAGAQCRSAVIWISGEYSLYTVWFVYDAVFKPVVGNHQTKSAWISLLSTQKGLCDNHDNLCNHTRAACQRPQIH